MFALESGKRKDYWGSFQVSLICLMLFLNPYKNKMLCCFNDVFNSENRFSFVFFSSTIAQICLA